MIIAQKDILKLQLRQIALIGIMHTRMLLQIAGTGTTAQKVILKPQLRQIALVGIMHTRMLLQIAGTGTTALQVIMFILNTY